MITKYYLVFIKKIGIEINIMYRTFQGISLLLTTNKISSSIFGKYNRIYVQGNLCTLMWIRRK